MYVCMHGWMDGWMHIYKTIRGRVPPKHAPPRQDPLPLPARHGGMSRASTRREARGLPRGPRPPHLPHLNHSECRVDASAECSVDGRSPALSPKCKVKRGRVVHWHAACPPPLRSWGTPTFIASPTASEQLQMQQGLLPESQGRYLALTFSYVP